jgi:hypothetical protein
MKRRSLPNRNGKSETSVARFTGLAAYLIAEYPALKCWAIFDGPLRGRDLSNPLGVRPLSTFGVLGDRFCSLYTTKIQIKEAINHVITTTNSNHAAPLSTFHRWTIR